MIMPDIVNEIKSDFGVFLGETLVFSDRKILDPPPEKASIPNIMPKKNGLNLNFIIEIEKSGFLYMKNIVLKNSMKIISSKPAISVYLIEIFRPPATVKYTSPINNMIIKYCAIVLVTPDRFNIDERKAEIKSAIFGTVNREYPRKRRNIKMPASFPRRFPTYE